MKKELICISCPIGCRLEAVKKDNGTLEITGNQCPKGEEYAKEEINAPKRIVTTTVRLAGPNRNRVPVRTDKALPLAKIQPLLTELHAMDLSIPIKKGDVIIENFEHSGVNVISSLSFSD